MASGTSKSMISALPPRPRAGTMGGADERSGLALIPSLQSFSKLERGSVVWGDIRSEGGARESVTSIGSSSRGTTALGLGLMTSGVQGGAPVFAVMARQMSAGLYPGSAIASKQSSAASIETPPPSSTSAVAREVADSIQTASSTTSPLWAASETNDRLPTGFSALDKPDVQLQADDYPDPDDLNRSVADAPMIITRTSLGPRLSAMISPETMGEDRKALVAEWIGGLVTDLEGGEGSELEPIVSTEHAENPLVSGENGLIPKQELVPLYDVARSSAIPSTRSVSEPASVVTEMLAQPALQQVINTNAADQYSKESPPSIRSYCSADRQIGQQHAEAESRTCDPLPEDKQSEGPSTHTHVIKPTASSPNTSKFAFQYTPALPMSVPSESPLVSSVPAESHHVAHTRMLTTDASPNAIDGLRATEASTSTSLPLNLSQLNKVRRPSLVETLNDELMDDLRLLSEELVAQEREPLLSGHSPRTRRSLPLLSRLCCWCVPWRWQTEEDLDE
ncbi:hypothetical protein BC832DRAFT_64882 [Gaertneriomyces semiglobifer]|nr:hypothetical protein BC832DRAFT_64882 [Gaertneriomyces semiglobifer]